MGSSGLGTDDERWAAGNGGGQWQCGLICGRWPGATAPAGSAPRRAVAPLTRLDQEAAPLFHPDPAVGGGGRSRWKAATTMIAGDDDSDDGDHEEGDG